ncbi:MAG: hypothetical protein ACK5MT_09605 [Actinomycetales bacterium]
MNPTPTEFDRPQNSHAQVQDIVSVLWPGHPPAQIGRLPGRARSGRQLWVFPRLDDPRLLVPVGMPGAERMFIRHGGGRVARAGRAALRRAVRGQQLVCAPLPRVRIAASTRPAPAPDDLAASRSVEELAATVLDHPVVAGVLLGPARINRKPVVEVFRPNGEIASFVKVAVNPLTTDLVRTETANLEQLSQTALAGLRIPTVLHAGSLGRRQVAMLDVLSSSQSLDRRTPTLPVEQMTLLAGALGSRHIQLAESPFLGRLRGLASHSVASDRLGALLAGAVARWGQERVWFGCWHGDWAPWNMGYNGDTVELWDWERFDPDVPWGFDAIHFRAQQVRHLSPQARSDDLSLRAGVPSLLGAMGSPGAQQNPDLVLVLYLVTIATRLLEAVARVGESGPVTASTGAPRADWAIDLAERVLG